MYLRDGDDDELANTEEDDRDALYYELTWGGPRDFEDDYGDGVELPEDTDPRRPPLPSPVSGLYHDALAHFSALKQKYGTENCSDPTASSSLYRILVKVDTNQRLSEAEVNWLLRNRMYGPIRFVAAGVAKAHEDEFLSSGDPWRAVLASAWWRKARRPERSLRILENLGSTEPKIGPAIMTTRGGALRDIGDLEQALKMGQEAIRLHPRSFHPYMLVGAVYYQLGKPAEGEEYFVKALELGAKPETREQIIARAISMAGSDARHVIGEYLMKDYPNTYKALKGFLDPPSGGIQE